MGELDAVRSSANQFACSNDMYTGFALGVRFVNEVEGGFGANFRNIGDWDKVTNLLALVFEVEASVSESGRKVDYRLSDFVNLLVGGNL